MKAVVCYAALKMKAPIPSHTLQLKGTGFALRLLNPAEEAEAWEDIRNESGEGGKKRNDEKPATFRA